MMANVKELQWTFHSRKSGLFIPRFCGLFIPLLTPGEGGKRPVDNNPVTYVPKPPLWKRVLPWLLLVIALGIIGYLLWNQFKPVPPAPDTPTPFATLTSTQLPTAVNTEIPVIVPTLAPTSTDTPIPTDTLTLPPTSTSTNTPTITPTIIITPSPTPNYLFQDDFTDTISEQWEITEGAPVSENDQLTTNINTRMVVGDPNWTDYQVDFDLIYNPKRVYVEVRVLGDRAVQVFIYRDTCGFYLIQAKGSGYDFPNSKNYHNRWIDPTHITVKIKGNRYELFLNGEGCTAATIDGFPMGRVALYFEKDTLIDNFKITALP